MTEKFINRVQALFKKYYRNMNMAKLLFMPFGGKYGKGG